MIHWTNSSLLKDCSREEVQSYPPQNGMGRENNSKGHNGGPYTPLIEHSYGNLLNYINTGVCVYIYIQYIYIYIYCISIDNIYIYILHICYISLYIAYVYSDIHIYTFMYRYLPIQNIQTPWFSNSCVESTEGSCFDSYHLDLQVPLEWQRDTRDGQVVL